MRVPLVYFVSGLALEEPLYHPPPLHSLLHREYLWSHYNLTHLLDDLVM